MFIELKPEKWVNVDHITMIQRSTRKTLHMWVLGDPHSPLTLRAEQLGKSHASEALHVLLDQLYNLKAMEPPRGGGPAQE